MKRLLLVILGWLLLNQMYAQRIPSIQLQKCLGGSSEDVLLSVVATSDSGSVAAGYSSSSGGISGSHGVRDGWVVKLNSAGNVQWQNRIGGSSYEQFNAVIQTSDGGYIAVGNTSSTDGNVSGYHGGGYDGWVVKLNRSGYIEWQRCLGGTHVEDLYSIVQSDDGGYVVTGYTSSTDGDVYINSPNPDGWVVKLSSTGSIQWQQYLKEKVRDIVKTNDGGYAIVAQTFSGSSWIIKLNNYGFSQWEKLLVFNPLAGNSAFLSIIQTIDGGYCVSVGREVTKFNSLGDIQWSKLFLEEWPNMLHNIIQTHDGGYLAAGTVLDSTFTSSFGVAQRGVLLKLSSSGRIQWKRLSSGFRTDYLYDVAVSNAGGYLAVGSTNSPNIPDYHSGTSHYDDKDGLFIKASGAPLISGKTSYALNAGIGIPNVKVMATAVGDTQSVFTDWDGVYTTEVFALNTPYNIQIQPFGYLTSAMPTSHSALFSAVNQIDSLNHFSLVLDTSIIDLRVSATCLTSIARQGRDLYYDIDYINNNANTHSNVELRFQYNDSLSVRALSLQANIDTTGLLVWNFPLGPFQSGKIRVRFVVPTTMPIGTRLCVKASILPNATAQSTSRNAIENNCVEIRGSYDPNDKQVFPEGVLFPNWVNADSNELVYTVRFQNTGNDTAFLIVVRDTLSDLLDHNSLRPISASHKYQMSYSKNVASWAFENILLPDSFVNERESHGYFKYAIKPKTGLKIGDNIKNSAAIYFDYNEPVITNTVISRVDKTSNWEISDQIGQLMVFPNPTTGKIYLKGLDVESALLYNVQGQVVLQGIGNELNLSSLPSGMYQLLARTNNQLLWVKVVKE